MDLETLKILTEYLDSYTYPKDFTLEEKAKLRRQALLYFLRDNKLFRKNRKNPKQPLRVISALELDIILYNMHTDPLTGHFALKGTV